MTTRETKLLAANAALEAEVMRLRDALQEYIDEHEECQDADDWMAMMCSIEAHHTADEALSQPSDTSALDTFVAEKVKEAGKFDMWKTNPYTKVLETSIEQLTKQRDLAVEALEDATTSLETIHLRSYGEESYLDSRPLMRSYAGARAKVSREALSAIKESEIKG